MTSSDRKLIVNAFGSKKPYFVNMNQWLADVGYPRGPALSILPFKQLQKGSPKMGLLFKISDTNNFKTLLISQNELKVRFYKAFESSSPARNIKYFFPCFLKDVYFCSMRLFHYDLSIQF